MKNNQIQIVIDGKKISAKENQTILEVILENGMNVPALCFHPDLKVKSHCRLCLIEIKGERELQYACSTKIKPGMEIITDSLEIKKARKVNLESIFSQHRRECFDCIWMLKCQLLKLGREYDVDISRFSDVKNGYPIYRFGPSLIFDTSKCINCHICVDICHQQGVDFLEVQEKDNQSGVVPSKNEKRDCIYCGQCLIHCPVGAFEGIGEFEDSEKPFKEKDKIVIVQFAPAIRTSIGEEFGLDYGEVVTEKLVGAIKKLGANKVFDTSVGADFTTTEEAKELIGKIQKKDTPCLSSCCPSWVKFIEFNYPEFIPHLATARSPQVILGGLIKTYWAEKENIDPEKIVVVSIMPCVAKKYEIEREELRVKGFKPVDYVLTTRELSFLLKKNKIDLKEVKPEKADTPLGVPSGAGVIYGASGGVAESALRTAYELITKKKLEKLDFKKIRGLKGVKKAKIEIDGQTVKLAVVNGIGNAIPILEELKKNPQAYDAVEVMACPGGCIGGGGQPVPVDDKIRKLRAQSLYKIDDKAEIRLAHQNPAVKKIYENFLNSKDKINLICHTKYFPKKKEVKFK